MKIFSDRGRKDHKELLGLTEKFWPLLVTGPEGEEDPRGGHLGTAEI
jgi:hypothetical protein